MNRGLTYQSRSTALLIAALALTSCSGDECSAETYRARSAEITLVDADTGDEVCDVFVSADDGTGAGQRLFQNQDSCIYRFPAWEIPFGDAGTRTIRAAGYLPAAVELEIEKDECGVIKAPSATVELTPDPNADEG